jgi:hypothetical protein
VPSRKKERDARLVESRSGAWASASQDYMQLCHMLYQQSCAYAEAHDGNVSPYPLAGVPLLFSALRALLIECNSGMFGKAPAGNATLQRLCDDPNELLLLREQYSFTNEAVMDNLALLYEVRNEIVHPAHRPAGTKNNTPPYMVPLRELDILQSRGEGSEGDYGWYAQLQSHKLFRWVCEQVAHAAAGVIDAHHSDVEFAELHKATYFRFRQLDA